MKFDTFKGADGKWFWRCGPSTGGRKTADGSEGYATQSNARRAVRKHIATIRARVCRIDGEVFG